MRDLSYLDKKRILFRGAIGDKHNGCFKIQYQGTYYFVIASDGLGWDHVSVSNESRIPSWEVMCKIKEMFFEDEEVVYQLHPAKSDYINIHKHCLHLWRPHNQEIPLPPKIMV